MERTTLTLSCWLWIGSLTACATTPPGPGAASDRPEAAGAVEPGPPGPLPSGSAVGGEESTGPAASALAYGHYLKARLLVESGRPREAVLEMRQALVYDGGSPWLHVSLGRLYARQALWRLASEEAEAALELKPDHVEALLLRADGQVQAQRLDEAVATLTRIVALAPRQIDAFARLAAIYLDRKQRDLALGVLERMTDANPDSAAGFRKIGDIYFERGEEARAEQYFRRALAVDPNDLETIQLMSSLLEGQGRYKESIAVQSEALEVSPEDPSVMAALARLYLKDGDEAAAQAYLAQLRAGDPSNAYHVAQALVEVNQQEAAIAELERAVAASPGLDGLRMFLAYLYEERKEFDKTLVQMQRVPPDSRFYLRAQTTLGYALQRLDRLQEATQVLEAARQKAVEPEDVARVLRTLGVVLAKLQRTPEALRLLDQGLQANPDLPDLIEAKASVLQEAGRGAEGVKLLRAALERKPEEVALLYALGALLEQLGQADESIAAMRKLLEVDPNNSAALNFIGYTLADQNRELDEAERLIRRALLLNPGNGAITDSLGWLLFRRGDYPKALEYLQRADRISPGEAVIIMHIGDAHLKLGQRDEAVQHYQRALQSRPEPRDRREIEERLQKLGLTP
jgi:tetratricopeptide (TPR) repeat protein